MSRAKDYIELADRELARNQNFMNLYQDTSDFVYPLENQITNRQTPGNDPKTIQLTDTTAIFASMDMASNLSATLFPPGQQSFSYRMIGREFEDDEEANVYLSGLTEAVHETLFNSNFMVQFNEALRSWVVFGEGDIYTERGEGQTINFMDFPAGSFQYQEDSDRKPDSFIERFKWTARQCKEKWGDGIGPKIAQAAAKEETENKLFEIVHVIRKRKKRNVNSLNVLNFKYEDVFVGVDDQNIIFESGFREFPHAIGRYMKSSKENRGRGVGVEILPEARALNSIDRDLIESANRHNRPPIEVSGEYEGEINTDPNAVNHTFEQGTISAIQGLTGNYPITKDILEFRQEKVRKAFLEDVFNQLMNLQGDRRTTLEISERLNEGLRRLANPIGRLLAEMVNPLLTRVAFLMIRNRMYPPPPERLQGAGFKIDHTSPLVLALKRSQAQAFTQWVAVLGEMSELFPDITDNVNSDDAARDLADAFGVKSDHKKPIQERDAVRAQRAFERQKQQEMELAQVAGNTYSQTTKAPEEGSAAKELQEVVNAG